METINQRGLGMNAKELNYKAIGIVLGLVFGVGGILLTLIAVANIAPTRGAGLLVMVVFLFGFGGYTIAKHSPPYLEKAFLSLRRGTKTTRAYMFGVGLWGLAVILFVMFFEPFGYSMSDDDIFYAFKAFCFPPLLIGLGHYGFEKFVKGR